MPSFFDVRKETNHLTNIKKHVKELYESNDRNIVLYYSGFLSSNNMLQVDINDRDITPLNAMCDELDPKKGLDLFLHTPGGDVAATESIIDYLRNYFSGDVRAIIPQLAMSGGTMIACSCKEIIMGKHSSLGPVDPQIGGVPAHEILSEFSRIEKEIDENPGKITLWQPILSQYPPTLLGTCEKAIEWSNEILENSLKMNMFKAHPNDEKISDSACLFASAKDIPSF